MNIIIHGTKGGYRSCLYATPNTPLVTFDSRSAASLENAVGQTAYSISFSADGYILTKFVIVRDGPRSMATGNIAFSIYLHNNQRLSGVDAKSLLDQLSNHYCKLYSPDYNLGNIYEDWSFVENIARNFNIKNIPADDVENIQQGANDAAYVYYTSDEEMQKYFDAPYQEEYKDYRQVFFIEKRLEGKIENPLNALKHNPNANLTGKIDLAPYKLLFNEQAKGGVKIEVKVRGNRRHNKNKIRKKDILEISYTKDYHEPRQLYGKWNEIDLQFIEVNDTEQTIYIRECTLQPKTTSIPIAVVDALSEKPIPNFHVVCKHSYGSQTKEINGNQIIFEGSEIGERWDVKAMSDGYKEESRKINPENCPDIKFLLTEQRIFTIEVRDHENDEAFSPRDYTVTASCNRNTLKDEKSKIVFTGDEIKREWHIEIKKNGYELYGEKVLICPCNENEKEPIRIYIKRKHQTIHPNSNKRDYYFSFVAGRNGKVINDSQEHGPYSDFNDYKKVADTKPNFGYKFHKFVQKNRSDDNHYVFEAQFKPILSWKFVSILGALVAFVIVILLLTPKDEPKQEVQQITPSQITQYVEGDSLLIDTLKNYMRTWEDRKPEIKIKQSVWYNSLTWFGKNEQPSDSAELNEWQRMIQNIELAIDKRKLVDNADFEGLMKLQYFPQQENFRTAIERIEVDNYDAIKTKLGSISSLTLYQIADSIEAIMVTQKGQEEERYDQKTDTDISEHIESKNHIKSTYKSNTEKEELSARSNKTDIDIEKEFEAEFWILVRNGSVNKADYDNLITKYSKISYRNEYKKFYDKYLSTNESRSGKISFEEFRKIPDSARRKAKTLAELEDLIKQQ